MLWEDFNGAQNKVPLVQLLRLLDRYPLQVRVKGGFVWWSPKRVIITTNTDPNKWYEWGDRKLLKEALFRRLGPQYWVCKERYGAPGSTQQLMDLICTPVEDLPEVPHGQMRMDNMARIYNDPV